MKEIFLDQNTQEWLDYRRTRIGASDAPVIMGLSPWTSAYDLYMSKVHGVDKKQNFAMNRGKELEPLARELFEKSIMVKVTPKVVEHEKLSWMMASLDGISDDGQFLVEIKCPHNVSSHIKAMSGEIPDHYQAQMQHQMYVTGLQKAIYFSYFEGEGEMILLARDDEFIKRMLKEEKKFLECIQKQIPPELDPKEDAILEMSEEFNSISDKYKTLDISLKLIEEEKEILRDQLIEIAAGRNIKGNGVSVSKQTKEGRIDYKSMPGAFRDEIEKFRSPKIESWMIRIT